MKKKVTQTSKHQTLSTSEARANFAEALGMAQDESTVIGFDRYGKLVAAVVPIDAVRMLAGRGADVDPAVRAKIERMSRNFMHALPRGAKKARAGRQERAALEVKPKQEGKRRKKKREKKAKAASGKRARRITRKI